MARISNQNISLIYDAAEKWKQECLISGGSLFWPGEKVWTTEVLAQFKKCFIDNPDESKDSFEEKFQRQLTNENLDVTRLACEILFIYFLFPSSVGRGRKEGLIKTVAGWKGLEVDTETFSLDCFNQGIGNPGLAYNTRRPFEVAFIAELAIELVNLSDEDREKTLSDHSDLRKLLDKLRGDRRFQSRDVMLYLLYPDEYERMASQGHKNLIARTFQDVLGDDETPEDLDDKILAIRKKLEELLPDQYLDFYESPLYECWHEDGESEELSPAQGLNIKSQIVFYGPPGTGKTFGAVALAKTWIRQSLLKTWGPAKYFSNSETVEALANRRFGRIQFHPGYGYEDLVRGLQIGESGETKYEDGVLLRLVKRLEDEDNAGEIPYVLILDEMNRADLSKVLGECFSLLEDRGTIVQLAGHDETPREVRLPENLYFIGTMNLIDQSLEQVDFALRRRFLWFYRGFEQEDFIAVAKYRWEKFREKKPSSKPWGKFEDEFEELSNRAVNLNTLINQNPFLGPQYQIGHTYFCDVVQFAQQSLSVRPGQHRILFNGKGDGRDSMNALWKYSLEPLLEQYLSGIDQSEQKAFIARAKDVLLKGQSA